MADNFFKVRSGVTLAPQAGAPSNPTNGDLYYDTALAKFRKYENGAWSDLGSGGSGSGRTNFVTNPTADTDTVGWTTYKDAAGVAPVDGTGGAPTLVTFTRSASSPLFGAGSFLFTKAVGNAQGEGVSTDFAISPVFQNSKELELSFYYSVNSGTYATGDVVAYLYDITNSLLIAPALTQLNSGNNLMFTTFKTSATSSTSYRLILHVSSTTTSAFELKMDNFIVGPGLSASTAFTTVPDSSLTLNTSSGFGSTWTRTIRFVNVTQNLGDAVAWADSAANGSTFTILRAGIYNITANFRQDTGTEAIAIVKNLQAAQQTTTPSTITPAQGRLVVTTTYKDTGQSDSGPCSYSGWFDVGDVVRILGTTVGSSQADNSVSITYQGAIKSISAVNNQTLSFPTSKLRFEGCSARGSTDTAIAKFDTIANLSGDGFSIVNTAANGTVVTIRKAGQLSISGSINLNSAGSVVLTKNQTNLTLHLSNPANEILTANGVSASNKTNIAWTGEVAIGDVIRVASEITPTSATTNNFSFSLVETNTQVALNTVQPQWSQSDSASEVNTGNGFGSTGTFIRRFANVANNLGSAITYQDSATLGASWTINETGVYDFNLSDIASSGNLTFYVTKNQAVLSAAPANSEVIGYGTPVGGGAGSAPGTAYLVKGDVIRCSSSIPGQTTSASPAAKFFITKQGKPNLTAVDVTPFVLTNTQQDVEAIRLHTGNGFGSTNTVIRRFATVAQNTNKGILKYEDSATLGASFTALKPCRVTISYQEQTGGGSSEVGLSLNLTGTITTGIGGIPAANRLVQNSSSSASITNMKTTNSVSVLLAAGDVIRPHVDSPSSVTTPGIVNLTVLAEADTSALVSTSNQISSDTMAFAFKATAIDPLTDPVGTFNTYTYASGGSSPTIATTAPTQTFLDMNANGVRVFSRAYNATSTAANPARVDIFIGKGLKSRSIDAYGAVGKVTKVYTDFYIDGTASAGTKMAYNELTGVLTLTAGVQAPTTTSAFVGVDDSLTTYTSGYFVFNASSNPALLSVPLLQPRIAVIRDERASGVAGPTPTTSYTGRNLNTITDPTGIVANPSAFTGVGGTNTTIVLTTGTYKICATAQVYNPSGASGPNRVKLKLRNTTDSTDAVIGLSSDAQSNSGVALGQTLPLGLNGIFTVSGTKSFELQLRAVNASGNQPAASFGDNEVYTVVELQKIN